jgi:hypothetical protein
MGYVNRSPKRTVVPSVLSRLISLEISGTVLIRAETIAGPAGGLSPGNS